MGPVLYRVIRHRRDGTTLERLAVSTTRNSLQSFYKIIILHYFAATHYHKPNNTGRNVNCMRRRGQGAPRVHHSHVAEDSFKTSPRFTIIIHPQTHPRAAAKEQSVERVCKTRCQSQGRFLCLACRRVLPQECLKFLVGESRLAALNFFL